MDKKDLLKDGDSIYAYINACIVAWEGYAHKEIKRIKNIRNYFYRSDVESDSVMLSASISGFGNRKITLSPVRTSLNRAKTDLRDQEPSLRVFQRVPSTDNKKLKVNQAILEEITLNNQNYDNLYSIADSILDMSYTVAQLIVEKKYNEDTQCMDCNLVIQQVSDLLSVSFDCSVPFEQINKNGKHVSFKRDVKCLDVNGKTTTKQYLEHFEKIYQTVKYGTREDAISGKVITEKVKQGVKYICKQSIQEVSHIQHWGFCDKILIKNEKWPYKMLPFAIASGVVFDNYDTSSGAKDRLNIVPYAEHVIRAQDLLNQAATMMAYNLDRTRGTSKMMYFAEQVKGHEATWKNRNLSDTDLPINPIKDAQGNPQYGILPQAVPDTNTSPVVTEIMQALPGQIQQMLGNEHEDTINYNKSGEAIRAAQVIASKNAKLYLDGFERFLGFLGECIEHYMPIVYDSPRYIAIDVAGATQIEAINTHKYNSIKSILNAFKIEISLGSNKQSDNDKTIMGLTSLWQATAGSDIGVQIVQSTLDIYANSLDTSRAQDIAKRVSLYLPAPVLALESGANSKDIIAQNQNSQTQQAGAQQAIAAQQAQKEQALADAKQQSEIMKAQASEKSAEGRLLSGQAAMLRAQKEGHVPPTVHINEEVTR